MQLTIKSFLGVSKIVHINDVRLLEQDISRYKSHNKWCDIIYGYERWNNAWLMVYGIEHFI